MENIKDKRRRLILQILQKQDMNTQDDLVRELSKHGVRVTQATLSRDLADIGVIRASHPDGSRYQLPAEPVSIRRQVIPAQILSIDHNESVVLIKALSGCAPSVAAVIDSWNLPGVMGTVAGDDTILILPKNIKGVKRLAADLEQAISSKR